MKISEKLVWNLRRTRSPHIHSSLRFTGRFDSFVSIIHFASTLATFSTSSVMGDNFDQLQFLRFYFNFRTILHRIAFTQFSSATDMQENVSKMA